jgi:DNA-binding CsgD family transcriptional regulator
MELEKDFFAIEQLYDNLFREDGWAAVIARIAESFQSESAGFFEHSHCDRTDVHCHLHGLSERVDSNPECQPSPTKMAVGAPGCFLVTRIASDPGLVMFTADSHELKRGDFYQDRPCKPGLDPTLGLMLEQSGDNVLVFTLTRSAKLGDFTTEEKSRFRNIARHLVIALGLQQKMQAIALQARINEQAINAMNVGVFHVSGSACVHYMNPYAEHLVRHHQGLSMQAGLLSLITPQGGNDALSSSLRSVSKSLKTAAIRSQKPYGGHLSITISTLSDVRVVPGVSGSAFLMLVTDSDDTPVKQLALLRSLWELTDSEARLILKLMSGETLKEAAQSIGITYETARYYIKRVYRKCGVSGQGELIALVLRQMV